MQNHDQLLEDERIAIALSQAEAEQYDNRVFDRNEEYKELFRYPTNNEVFDRIIDRRPELEFFSEIDENRRRMEERMKSHFEDFKEPEMFEYVSDEIPEYVLQAMFEDLEISKTRNRNEEVKRESSVGTRNVGHVERGNNVNYRNQDTDKRIHTYSNRQNRGKRGSRGNRVNGGVISRPGIANEAANYMFDDDNASYEQLVKLDEDNFEKGNGFSELKLVKLKAELYKTTNSRTKETCPICMSEFNTKEFVIKLSCKHVFHKVCIKEWLSRKKTCAVCKIEVKL